MNKLITILLFVGLVGCSTIHAAEDPNLQFKDETYSKEKYQKFLNKERKNIEKYLEGRNDLHPILRACYLEQAHAFLEYQTFKEAGLLRTTENQEIIWKISQKGLMVLFYKYTVVFKWGECLEKRLQTQWKDVRFTYK
tara:strand:- start:1610 stop:2023 length:414 start_codon:yes stop_codon:yes gene_type:complete